MTERAELMRIYRSNGISSISLMRDHYNKHDNGGDIQPSDATFRATLINPVNSYRSNAPAGIGDAAITKATGLLNPITAATLTAAPLGAISKINAAAKAYKAAKIANPIIARGPGIYTSNSTDIAKQFSNRGYIGDLSLDFGIASNESPLEKLKRYKKALPQVDNAVSPASLETTRLMWSLREGDINQKEFINKARNTFGYKGIEGTYYYNSIPPRSERVLYESPKVNKVYEASTFNQTLPVKESDLFITQRGEGSVPYIFKRLQKENPSAVGEAIQQLTTLEQSRRDRIQEAARYYQNIQDRAKIGATVAGVGLGAYGIYKAIDSKKAFGGNMFDTGGYTFPQINRNSFRYVEGDEYASLRDEDATTGLTMKRYRPEGVSSTSSSNERQYISDWYNHPNTIERIKRNTSNPYAEVERQRGLFRASTLPIYVGDRDNFIVPEGNRGSFNSGNNVLGIEKKYIGTPLESRIKMHELNHTFEGLHKIIIPEEMVENAMSSKGKKLVQGDEGYDYSRLASEMHSRLMDIRYFLKKKPGEIISKEEYMKAKEALDGDSRFGNYDDDKMVEAINTIAFNNNNDRGSTT